jgi:hypothetical protein
MLTRPRLSRVAALVFVVGVTKQLAGVADVTKIE